MLLRNKNTIHSSHNKLLNKAEPKEVSKQIIESYSADDDYSVKIIGYDYFLKHLHLKHATKEKEIKEYYKRNAQKFEKQQALKA